MTTTPATAGNLADVVRAAALRSPEGPAMITADATCTWTDLDRAVNAGASALRTGGANPGDRVVLALPTGRELAAALFATLRAGLIAVPVRPGTENAAWVAERSGASVAVADEWDGDGVRLLTSGEVRGWWEATASAEAVDGGAGGEDIAVLARAARSGPPVMLSHRALLSAAQAVAAAPRLAMVPSDRVLQVLPLYHVVGLVTAFLPAAMAGAAVVVPEASTSTSHVEAALDAVQRHRVTVLPAEPTLYRQLDRIPDFGRALATVRLMTSGSSPLDPADLVAIRAVTGAGVREGYGISEAAAAVTSTLMCESARPGSVGLPYAGVEVEIRTGESEELVVDADVPTDAGDVGPVAIRGATLFSGYWPDGAGGPDEDGWYVTGDIGYVDDDGELHMVDRAAETVVIAGFTVYPREVEDVLASHPYVADAAVVGVSGRGGPTVVAALVPAAGTRPTEDDLDEFVADKLAPFKRPTAYHLVDRLPRTEVGRLDRDAVREMCAAAVGITIEAAAVDAEVESEPDVDTDDAASGAAGAEVAPEPAVEVDPEEAPDLDDLGAKLPAASNRAQRSAQDSDEDLF